ncbi:MAG: arginine--tRNA ligase [Actinomycetota bacterium]|nr:arginine--tRNA ligase [Actinomycetota bacterium]
MWATSSQVTQMASSGAVAQLRDELSGIAGASVELQRPNDVDHGDYATNVALRLAPERRRSPRELAAEIARAAIGLDAVERAEAAGPGFVNLWLQPAWYGEALREILAAGRDYGAGSAPRRERIQVETVSANPTGPVVVSAGRNGAYGDSVARLLEFAGHEVEREYYYNDAGTQMELFRASIEAVRRGEEPPEGGYRGDYVAELAQLEGDPVPHVVRQIEATLERFRIHFDSWALESEMRAEVPAMLATIPTYEADGAIWLPTSQTGFDDKDRVVVRSNGKPTYFAGDVAYMRHKLERFNRAIYVLGADHHGYVGRLKAVAKLLGRDPDDVEILVYQLVHLTEGGEQRKMGKRSGDVVLLDDFLDEVGVDAARWYLVSRGPDQTIEIDVDLAAQRSQKNPVYYVQYAHARIAGITRNAGDASVSADPPAVLAKEEGDLVKRLAEFPDLVSEATDRRAPHAIPAYAIRVADDFHRFYHRHRVLGSGEAEPFRLALCHAAQSVIARSLDLLGVEAPERM